MKKLLILFLLMAICISMCACGGSSAVKHELLGGVSLGMTGAEVRDVLGEPTSQTKVYYGTYKGKEPGYLALPTDNPPCEGAFDITLKSDKVTAIEYMVVLLSADEVQKLDDTCKEYYTSLYGEPKENGSETVWKLGGKTTVKISRGVAFRIGIYTE